MSGNGQRKVLEGLQSDLAGRIETLRNRVLAEIRDDMQRGLANGWLVELEGLSRRIGGTNVHLSLLADADDKARATERQEAHAAERQEMTAPEAAA